MRNQLNVCGFFFTMPISPLDILQISRLLYLLDHTPMMWGNKYTFTVSFSCVREIALTFQRLGENTLLSSASRDLKERYCWSFAPFVVARTACSSRWMWKIGGAIRAGKTEVLGEKLTPLSLLPPQKTHALARDRTHSPGWEAGDWPFEPFKKPELYLNIQVVPHSKHLVSVMKPVS